MRVNLGCGRAILPGWVNVDACPDLGPGVEVWDLDEHPWPFEDGSAAEIRGFDIFEHVEDAVGFMAECHRILAPGGVLRLQTTHHTCIDAYTDPTHKRFPTEQTFDYWIRGTIFYDMQNVMMGGFHFEPLPGRPAAALNPGTGQMDVYLRKPGGSGG